MNAFPAVIALSGLLVLSCLFALPGALAAEPDLPPGRDHDFGPGEDERAHAIQRTYQESGREIGEAHAAALRSPKLVAPLEEFRKVMEEEMIRLAPEQKTTILRRYAVHREMVDMGKIEQPTEEDKARFQDLGIEFANLSETIGDLPQRAAETPRMLEAREKFRVHLHEVMTEINPRVPDLMQEQRKAALDYMILEQELLKKHGGKPLYESKLPEP